jgi:hypothetical protein
VTILRGDSLFEYWGDFEPHIMDSVRFAGTRQDSLLIGDEVAAITLSPFAGLVGRDLLSQFDLEFDMPRTRFASIRAAPSTVGRRSRRACAGATVCRRP